ncbi:calcium-binding protein [Cognatishimia sp. F0-27]|uniref:calcium-binding protein n=1 Tax=Cognatishimia sp. F0-27 TaxID=2816855 RepID=UPI001D0C275D|nr:calcium-binding protein [Cognatishimia sp. F0-27]MCC1493749.1 calcium-binding protein [Cognatishimia sp. F0-27]
MPDHALAFLSATGTDRYVSAGLFGANALHRVNLSEDSGFAPTAGFEASLDAYGIRALRYPGGHSENTIDITHMPNGALREEVRAFFDWCRAQSDAGSPCAVTVVLPTKANIPAERIEAFVQALLDQYGDLVVALEIGNEYSIGPVLAAPDRTIHPEQIPDSDRVGALNETEYGIVANRVINAVQTVLERMAETMGAAAPDPMILLQFAETNGAASDFKRGENAGDYRLANAAILAELDMRARDAVDAGVAHYYYNASHAQGPAFGDVADWRLVRRIDERFADFEARMGRDLPLVITEWNVVAGNTSQLGATSASVMIEMFERMVQMGVTEAHVWPVQHRTPNALFGNRDIDGTQYTMAGGAFSLLVGGLRPRLSETGHLDQVENLQSEWANASADIEINHFRSAYRDVLYVSSRQPEPLDVTLDLGALLGPGARVTVDHMTIDRATSDGLSDLADPAGRNRIARREIDQDALDRLATLPFFDPDNEAHIKRDASQLLTYLPPYETIIPLVADPQGLDDFYFAAEVDVAPLITTSQPQLGAGEPLALGFMPYDVTRVIIDRIRGQEGGNGADTLTGGIGRDSLSGRAGNDRLEGGEDADSLQGGAGDDRLFGGPGSDRLIDGHGDGADLLHGQAGDDEIRSLGGADWIEGGSGDDRIHLEPSAVFGPGFSARHALTDGTAFAAWSVSVEGLWRLQAVVQGGSGVDRVQLGAQSEALFLDDVYSAVHPDFASTVMARLRAVEAVHAGAGDDLIDLTTNRFPGALEDVSIFGEAGHDTLWGTDGDDTIHGGAGDDVIAGGGGADRLSGGTGADAFHVFLGEAGVQRILDFSVSEGDRLVLHIPSGQDRASIALDLLDGVLALSSGEGAANRVLVDLGTQTDGVSLDMPGRDDWLDVI